MSNDGLLSLQLAHAKGLGPVIAVTGSSGKTTTTTLAGQMLAWEQKTVHVGGNIGLPLVDRIDRIEPGEPIVLELSSFQLELFDPALTQSPLDGVGPQVGAITNLTPNHLDRHPSMKAYVAAKLNMVQTMPNGSHLVLNLDDAVTGALASPRPAEACDDRVQDWDLCEVVAVVRAPNTGLRNRDRAILVAPASPTWRLPERKHVDGRRRSHLRAL